MISHSPPIFSHSPPVSFLSDRMNNRHQQMPFNDELNRSLFCRPQATKAILNNPNVLSLSLPTATLAVVSSTQQYQQQQQQQSGNGNNAVANRRNTLERKLSAPEMPSAPKSCLSRRNNDHSVSKILPSSSSSSSSSSSQTQQQKTTATTNSIPCSDDVSLSRTRKKVVFADDEGLSLTHVRIMSEPSNVPPNWSIKFLEQITQGLVSPHPADQWTIDFKQPASDYLSFRQAIERDFVSLENVIVKDDESLVVGTVKVKNIGFQKEVIVRVTWDNWKSQQDIFCTYSRAYGPATLAHVVFDTFSFKITLPPSSKKLEFCICFRANEQEYWDNNDGKNYTISKRSPFYYPALAPYDKNTSRNGNERSSYSTSNKLTDMLAGKSSCVPYGGFRAEDFQPYW